jgi:tryptophan 2,3-dioxygenase
MKPTDPVYYGDYLQLNKVLEAQHPKSDEAGAPAHDEMLFIITHQAYELWFKQMVHELNSIRHILAKPSINDNSSDIYTVVHRLKRISSIWDLCIKQIDVIETMTPLDFLDFRDYLRPASGFQSFMFKTLEVLMGLTYENRFGKAFYQQHLQPAHIKQLADLEKEPSLLLLIEKWLRRMPFFNRQYWGLAEEMPLTAHEHPFWMNYRSIYKNAVLRDEEEQLKAFDRYFMDDREDTGSRLSCRANRAALFILLYRDFPLLTMPFQLLDTLILIDELMSTWRTRHINMVLRMLGARKGTGGSSGASYLKASRDKHYVFSELAAINTFLIERKSLPAIPEELSNHLGFST